MLSTVVSLPSAEGNAADHYIKAKMLLEKNETLYNQLKDIQRPEDVPLNIKLDDDIIKELIIATSIRKSFFVPQYEYIPQNPSDAWPNVFRYPLMCLGKILPIAGDVALKGGDIESAIDYYARALIMGQHLINERFSVMQILCGCFMQAEACDRFLSLYLQTGNVKKGKMVVEYIDYLKHFNDQIKDKSLAIGGAFRGGGNINLLPYDNVEIVIKILSKDQDAMFRREAAIKLGRMKLSNLFFFESMRARKALVQARTDADPLVRQMVEYALQYSIADEQRNKQLLMDVLKKLTKDMAANPTAKMIQDISPVENPIYRKFLDDIEKEVSK